MARPLGVRISLSMMVIMLAPDSVARMMLGCCSFQLVQNIRLEARRKQITEEECYISWKRESQGTGRKELVFPGSPVAGILPASLLEKEDLTMAIYDAYSKTNLGLTAVINFIYSEQYLESEPKPWQINSWRLFVTEIIFILILNCRISR